MAGGNENVCFPISTAELERRWKAIREAMDDQGIDILVMQNNNDFHGGYVKYFTDTPAVQGGYAEVIFYKDGPMTAIRHGAPREQKIAHDDPVNRGIDKIITRPTFAAVEYTRNYASDAVVNELKGHADKTIGLVCTTSMTAPFLDGLRNGNLHNVKFVNATDMVDEIKAIKSPEEIGFIKAVAKMQDTAIEAVRKEVRPGKRVFEMTALAQYVGQLNGSEQGLFLANTSAVGQPVLKAPRHMQNKVINEGDVFNILVENNGPGGYYCEIARTFVMGKATAQMKEDFEFSLVAQRNTLNMIKPGADPAEICATHNDFMVKNGRPAERRLYAHGQGYDLVERPMLFPDETMKIQANMNIVVHPTYLGREHLSGICDNYMTTESGVTECLHKVPQEIFEIH